MDTIVCIYKTFDLTEADLVKAQFEAASILCFLKTDDAGGMYPTLSMNHGIGIMINHEDADLALEVLRTRQVASETSEEDDDS